LLVLRTDDKRNDIWMCGLAYCVPKTEGEVIPAVSTSSKDTVHTSTEINRMDHTAISAWNCEKYVAIDLFVSEKEEMKDLLLQLKDYFDQDRLSLMLLELN
jgi:hypothetical protein